MRLDHVSYACSPGELADVVQRIGSDLGAPFTDGGIHPAFGTRNFILPLSGCCYVEVVAVLDHPAAEKAPFGRAVRRRADEGGGWMGWVVGTSDISQVEDRLGRPSVAGHRIRPDGVDLRWRQIGVLDLIDDPQVPFFVQWETLDMHPASAANGDISLVGMDLSGDPATVAQWLGVAELTLSTCLDGVDVHWVESEDHGLVSCEFQTPRGRVRID